MQPPEPGVQPISKLIPRNESVLTGLPRVKQHTTLIFRKVGYLANDAFVFKQLLHHLGQIFFTDTLLVRIVLHEELLDLVFLPLYELVLCVLTELILVLLLLTGSWDSIITLELEELTGALLSFDLLLFEAVLDLTVLSVKVCLAL